MAKKENISLAIARLIVGDQKLRRQAMGGALLFAAAQCFLGAVVLPKAMMENPWVFLIYWGLCLLAVCVAFGLALLDVLKLKQRHTRDLHQLKEKVSDDLEEEED